MRDQNLPGKADGGLGKSQSSEIHEESVAKLLQINTYYVIAIKTYPNTRININWL